MSRGLQKRLTTVARGLSPLYFLLPALLLMTACTGGPRLAGDNPEVRRCQDYYHALDQRIAAAGFADPGRHRMAAYPFLQSNRFLASFGPELEGPHEYLAWLEHLNRTARDALGNGVQMLTEAGSGHPAQARELAHCGQVLVAALADRGEAGRARVVAAARVPPAYHFWQRVAGFYPLAALPFQLGVVRDQRRLRQLADNYRETLPPGPHRFYRLPPEGDLPALQSVSSPERDTLGIPVIDRDRARQLLRHFAPSLALPAGARHNRIGVLETDAEGRVQVAVDNPALYTWVDFGRFRDRVTIRLNYGFWFPERPARAPLDLLAGHLDGLIWRVHLDAGLAVLGRDIVHQCGCWYRFYPVAGMAADSAGGLYREPVYIGEPLSLEAGKTLYLASGSHYLLAIRDGSAGRAGEPLALKPYRQLRTLVRAGAGEPVFGSNGIVPESHRPERFLFWPMGVPSAGAMRIAGRHAIAFVGVRHFDDPRLLETINLREVEK